MRLMEKQHLAIRRLDHTAICYDICSRAGFSPGQLLTCRILRGLLGFTDKKKKLGLVTIDDLPIGNLMRLKHLSLRNRSLQQQLYALLCFLQPETEE